MGRIRNEACPRCRDNGRDTRGDNLVIFQDGGRYCFSCGYRVPPNFVDVVRKQITQKQDGTKSLLPFDYTGEIPTHAWKWLLQYGLLWSYWKESVGYSPSEERLVFKVGEQSSGFLRFSIGRHTPRKVEGSTSSGSGGLSGVDRVSAKWRTWGDSHRHCEVVGSGSCVVLVEDIVSAHKVGQVTTTIPLFGVNWHTPHLFYLQQEKKPIKLWLDKDQEGSVKRKAMNLQLLTGCPVDIVITDKDPKELAYDEIERHLK